MSWNVSFFKTRVWILDYLPVLMVLIYQFTTAQRLPAAIFLSLVIRLWCHYLTHQEGGGPRVVVSTAAFHARVPGSVPGIGGLKETKMLLPHPRVKVSIVGSLRDREVACSASDRQGSNFESCVWRRGQCHLNHLTILRRFSWPCLGYLCTKVA